MKNQNISSSSENTFLSKLHTSLKQTRELALKAECSEVIAPILNNVERTYHSQFVNIAFIGSPNSGKSKLINLLLEETILKVNTFSSGKQFYIQASTKENQGFVLGEKTENYPLEKLLDLNLLQEFSQTEIEINICNQWLEENSFRLIEKLSLDPLETDREYVINTILKEADCIVLVIDSLMPLKKAETDLLLECEKLQIPVIITLSKLDDLLKEEQQDVIDYLNVYFKKHNTTIQNFPIDIEFSIENNRIENLKKAIEKASEKSDIRLIRTKQFARSLVDALREVYKRSQKQLEAQEKSNLKQKQKNKTDQIKLETQNLIWQEIEQDLDKKRHKVDEILRRYLEKNRQNLLEDLLLQVEKQNNIKSWWEKELPVILKRELEKIANSLSKEIDLRINSDMKWLQQEISRKFQYSLNMSNQENTLVEKNSIEKKEMQLSDIGTWKIISRVSTGGLMIGAMLLAPIPGVGVAASVFGGLAVEQLLNWNIKKEREKISKELTRTIEKVELEYTSEVSRKLKESYQQIISNLKKEQFNWQQNQLNSLMAIKRQKSNDLKVNWKQIIKEIELTINTITKDFLLLTKGE